MPCQVPNVLHFFPDFLGKKYTYKVLFSGKSLNFHIDAISQTQTHTNGHGKSHGYYASKWLKRLGGRKNCPSTHRLLTSRSKKIQSAIIPHLPYTEIKTKIENVSKISKYQQIVYSTRQTQAGANRTSASAVSAISFDKPNR